MRRFLQVIALSLALAAATSAAGADGLTARELKDGRRLYVGKCARCHKLYDPAKYSEAEWRSWMDKMSRKAKLKADQKELLERYLGTLRAGTNEPAK
ncbi:MAG TPA: cytochrome c [Candidatus Paceibacterota bacterium]|nr:cytochrome c [Candidatus Paceibacterota bacterium]